MAASTTNVSIGMGGRQGQKFYGYRTRGSCFLVSGIYNVAWAALYYPLVPPHFLFYYSQSLVFISVLSDPPLRMIDAMHKEIQTDIFATADLIMAAGARAMGFSVVHFAGFKGRPLSRAG